MRFAVLYQLVLPLGIVLVAMVVMGAWLAVDSCERAALGQIELQMQQTAATLRSARYPLNEAVLAQIKQFSNLDYVFQAADGRRVATVALTDEVFLPRPAASGAPLVPRLGARIAIGGAEYRYALAPIPPHPANSGGVLYLLYPESRWRPLLAAALRPSLGWAWGSCVAALALITLVAQRLSRRVKLVERQTARIAAGEFAPLPAGAWNDELRDLIVSVNGMAAQLAKLHSQVQAAERLRLLDQVGAGLAHQLRNGLAGARLAVQLYQREHPAAAQAEALDVALRQLRLLEERLRGFLELGMTAKAPPEPCDLGQLLDGVTALFGPRCRHVRTDLRWGRPAGSVLVRGDKNGLGQLFINLIDNAIDAAGQGGSVAVEMMQVERATMPPGPAPRSMPWLVVTVTDSGSGPPAELAEQLFEPFVTAKPDGLGLGLSIARRIVQEHGGRLDWRRADGHTCFVVELPGFP